MTLTTQQADLVAELREERNLSLPEISNIIGLSEKALHLHCLLRGIDGGKKRHKPRESIMPRYVRNGKVVRTYTPDEDRQLLELEKTGMKYGTIARILGRSRSSVLYRVATLARNERLREEAYEKSLGL